MKFVTGTEDCPHVYHSKASTFDFTRGAQIWKFKKRHMFSKQFVQYVYK